MATTSQRREAAAAKQVKNKKAREKAQAQAQEAHFSDPGYDYGDIPDFEAVDDSAFDRLLEWEKFDDPEYTTSVYSGNLIVSRKRVGQAWKGRAILVVDVTPSQMLDTFWILHSRHQWDPLFSFMKTVSQKEDGSELTHIASKKMPLVSRRDFLQRRKRIDRPGDFHAAVFLPCEGNLLPPMPQSIRGQIHFSGMVCRPYEGNRCRFTMCTDTSFGVPIPSWVMNQLIPVFARMYLNRLTRHLNGVIKQMEEQALADREPEEQENPGSAASSAES